MIEKDFEHITGLTDEFFKQSKIQKGLKAIEKENIKGWELWLQIEFSIFLSCHNKINDWKREYSITVPNKKGAKADFAIRPKRCSHNKYILLEFKQDNSCKTCLRKMLGDIKKIYSKKRYAKNMRSCWSVGVHRRDRKVKIKKEAMMKWKKSGFELDQKLFLIRYIRNTDYAYTIF